MQRVAYFINQYPKVSHSFIRREILALEAEGMAVLRIALRGWDAELVDPEDIAEQGRTEYVLSDGVTALVGDVFHVMVNHTAGFFRGLGLALELGWRADRPLPYHLIYFAEACRVLRLCQNWGAGHAHAHFGTNPTEVLAIVRALGGPGYSFTVHGPEEFDKPGPLKLRQKIRDSAFVVAISSYGRSQLSRWIDHADWHKIREVHCGLDAAFIDVDPSPPPASSRLVCVGRLCEQKGQLLLVEAARELVTRGCDFELVLAGDGEMRSEIEALINRYALVQQVRITGWLSSEAVRDELLAARAMVLPSFAEGLPVVIMEALALRRPVISTYIAGIPELVQPGINGWLVPAGDIAALADAMVACLEASPSTLAGMGDAGRRRALERHNVTLEARKLREGFDTAAGVSPAEESA